MSDMSAGQIVGGIVGAVAGWFVTYTPAGVVQGFALGAGIGGYIDPPAGPNLRGPTLDDKSFQSSAYGVSLPRLYGTIATMGNIIYLENNEYKAVLKKQQQGGKGGGGSTITTTTYYATFAVALAEAMPGSQVRRIWAGGKLIYDASTPAEPTGGAEDFYSAFTAVLAGTDSPQRWRYYDGTQNAPDTRMESVLGVGLCPSYSGTAYIIFYDFNLTDYGNGLAGCPIKVEIAGASSDASEWIFIDHKVMSGSAAFDEFGKYVLRPMDGGGNSIRVSYQNAFPFDFAVQTMNIESESHFSIGKTGSQFAPQFLTGYSERSKYGFVIGVENPNEEDEYDLITVMADTFAFRSPFQNEQYAVADFIHIYDVESSGVYFLIRGQLVQPEEGVRLPPGQWSFWRSGDSVLDRYSGSHLGVSSETDACAVSDSYALFVERGSLNPYFKLISLHEVFNPDDDSTVPKYSLIREFSLALEDALTDNTSCFIKDDLFYYLSNDEFLKIGIVDINNRTVIYKTFDVDPPYGYTIFRSMSVVGSMLCVSYGGAAKDQHYYYIQMGHIGNSAVKLSEIVSYEFHKAGLAEADYDLTEIYEDYVDGYRISDVGSARGAISQLQAAYLFDLVDSGYVISAKRRGRSSAGTITYDNMLADSGGKIIKPSFESVSLLPATYVINYLDEGREYDVNGQTSIFPAHSENKRVAEFAIVMKSDVAARLAEKLINLSHIESKSFAFLLPQKYLGVGVGDVWEIESSPGRFEFVRLESVSKNDDQTVSVEAKRHSYSGYISSALGASTDTPVGSVPYISASHSELLDIPMLVEAGDSYGYIAAAYAESVWGGAVLLRSDDGGQTYFNAANFGGETTIAYAINALEANDGYVVDYKGRLKISVINGFFESITEEQMLSGRHYLAYGVDGRWEVMQYAFAQVVDDYVELSCLVRGAFGTEWATSMHESGDTVVLLDDIDNIFVNSDVSHLGNEKFFKTVSIGKDVSSVDPISFAYRGVNLKPLPPASAELKLVAGDWHIECRLRTRYGSSFFYTSADARNEQVVSINYDILDAEGTLVRRINSAVEHVIYPLELQVVDFGIGQSGLRVKIYQLSQRVGNGYALEVSI